MCLIHIKVQSFIHTTVEFHVFAVINATLMKEARGQFFFPEHITFEVLL